MTQRHASGQPAAPAMWSRWLFFGILVLVSLPLVFNPGYYGHDELQWLAAADHDQWRQSPWQGWFDVTPFQYRPLTFNGWLLLSKWVGYQPYLMHAAVVAIGLANALLLRSCLMAVRVESLPASVAAVLFVLSPHAMQVHGWVGTLGDLFVLLCALLAIRTLQVQPRRSVELAVIAVLTVLALWSKESAIVVPALWLALWPWRRSQVLPAVVVSAAVVAIYLALRLDTILYPPRTDSGYAWSIANIPARLFDYAAFPFAPGIDEVHVIRLGRSPWRWMLGFAASIGLLVIIANAGWRLALMLVIGWIACLGPILLLSTSAAVYGYVASAWVVAVCAWSWPRLLQSARVAMLFIAALAMIHGAQIAQRLRHVGVLQAGLYAGLEPLLPFVSPAHPLRIAAIEPRDQPHLQRLLHQVPSWHRLPVSDRVIIVEPDAAPTHRLHADGQLRAVEMPQARSR